MGFISGILSSGGIAKSITDIVKNYTNQQPSTTTNTVKQTIKPLSDAQLDSMMYDLKPENGQLYNQKAYDDWKAQQSNDYINQLAEAQRKSRITALDKAKTNALGNLDTSFNSSLAALDNEKSGIEPAYYNKRNQAAGRSDIGAMNFAQYMASRGIKGNAGAMPEIYRNASLQGQIGALDQKEALDMSNIERRRANEQTNYNTNKLGIENAYQSDVSNAYADIEANTMQALIDQYNKNREYNLTKGQVTGTLDDGTSTLDKTNADRNYNLNTSELTGYYYPNANKDIPEQYQTALIPYMNDLEAAINDPNIDQTLRYYAEIAREKKLMDNPSLPNEYRAKYQTAQGMSAALLNKAKEIEIAYKEIENSFLPETLKLQAQRLQQQVATGSLDYDTALAQLNQIKAATTAQNIENEWAPKLNAASIAKSYSSGSETVKKSTYFDTSAKAVSDRFAQINERGNNASAYIKTPGSIEYNEIYNLIKSLPITNDEKTLLGNQYLK